MRYFVAPEGWLDADGQLASLHTSPVRPISILLGQDCTTFQTDTNPSLYLYSSSHTSSKLQARMLRYHKTGQSTINSRRIWMLKAGASGSTKASLALARRMPTVIATALTETTTCSLRLRYEADLHHSHASQSFPSGNPSLRYPNHAERRVASLETLVICEREPRLCHIYFDKICKRPVQPTKPTGVERPGIDALIL